MLTVWPQHNQTVIRPTPGRTLNHNQTIRVAPGQGTITNHNQTIILVGFDPGLATNHNQTLVRG